MENTPIKTDAIIEISRFMICKNSRFALFSSDSDDSFNSLNKIKLGFFNRLSAQTQFSKMFSPGLIIQGLCVEIYKETQRRGIKYWCALMEKSLWTLLYRYGFKLQCVGDDVDFFGSVRPYLANTEDFNATKLVNAYLCNSNISEDPEEETLRFLRSNNNHTLSNYNLPF